MGALCPHTIGERNENTTLFLRYDDCDCDNHIHRTSKSTIRTVIRHMDCDTMITIGEHYITPNDAEKIEELLSKITDKKIREKLSMVISNCKVQKREWEIMHTVNGNADIDSVEAASASFSLDGTNYPPYGKGIRGR